MRLGLDLTPRCEHPRLHLAMVPGWGCSTSHTEPAAPRSPAVQPLLLSLQIPAVGRGEELRPEVSSVAPPRACTCQGGMVLGACADPTAGQDGGLRARNCKTPRGKPLQGFLAMDTGRLAWAPGPSSPKLPRTHHPVRAVNPFAGSSDPAQARRFAEGDHRLYIPLRGSVRHQQLGGRVGSDLPGS